MITKILDFTFQQEASEIAYLAAIPKTVFLSKCGCVLLSYNELAMTRLLPWRGRQLLPRRRSGLFSALPD